MAKRLFKIKTSQMFFSIIFKCKQSRLPVSTCKIWTWGSWRHDASQIGDVVSQCVLWQTTNWMNDEHFLRVNIYSTSLGEMSAWQRARQTSFSRWHNRRKDTFCIPMVARVFMHSVYSDSSFGTLCCFHLIWDYLVLRETSRDKSTTRWSVCIYMSRQIGWRDIPIEWSPIFHMLTYQRKSHRRSCSEWYCAV